MTTDQTVKTYTVPALSCDHCVAAVSNAVERVAGVDSLEVDLDTKQVTVRGRSIDEGALRAAFAEAGYEPAA